MALIEKPFDGSKGKVKVKVPGGSDRTIYINVNDSSYIDSCHRLGNDNKVYNKNSGSYVSSNLADFIKQSYGEVSIFILTSLLFLIKILFCK